MMLVVNASNTAKDWAHVNRFAARFDVKLRQRLRRRGAAGAAGPAGAGGAAAARAGRGPGPDRVLPLRDREGRRRQLHHQPDGLHGRGRRSSSTTATGTRPRCGTRWCGPAAREAGRAGRARQPAARDGLPALRQRHRRRDDAARRGAGLDREVQEGRLRGEGRARGAAGPGADAQADGVRAEGPRVPASRLPGVGGGQRSGDVRSGIVSPSLGRADRHGVPPARPWPRRATGSRSRSAASGSRLWRWRRRSGSRARAADPGRRPHRFRRRGRRAARGPLGGGDRGVGGGAGLPGRGPRGRARRDAARSPRRWCGGPTAARWT